MFTVLLLALAAILVDPTPTPIPSTFHVSGVIQDASLGTQGPNRYVIQAGPGCGYLYINVSAQTVVTGVYQIGRTATANGVGTCATEMTATHDVTYSGGATPTPTPAPTATPTPVPTPTPSPTGTPIPTTFHIEGVIQSVALGTVDKNRYVVHDPVCANEYVNISSQSLVSGTWAIGNYVKANGIGTCSTEMTATHDATYTGSNPTPTPTPTGTATPVPTPTPTSGPLSGANCLSIVNGNQWPLSCRPYASNAPWNVGTAGRATDAGLTGTLQADRSMYLGSSSGWPSGQTGSNDYSHPVYLASSSDHQVTVSCGSYGCWSNDSRVGSLTFRIPDQARPAQASDHHIGIFQPDGSEVDCWGAAYNGGTSFSASICATNNFVNGSGIENPSPTSGATVAGGLVRANEVNAGVIPHAFFLVAQCTSGLVWPGTSNASACSGSTGVPIGAWIHLKMTSAQINALPASAGNKAILTALANYGAFVMDTGGTGNRFAIMYEGGQQYASYGKPYPSFPGGTAVDWAQISGSMEVLQHP